MASFLCNQSILVSCPCSSSFSSNPFPKSKTLSYSPHLPRSNNLTRTTNPSLLHRSRRPLFKSYLASPDSFPTINNETEDSPNDRRVTEDDGDIQSLPSLAALIEAYKEAILNRDEKAISWIEVRIKLIETKKTELIKELSTLSAEKVASKEKCLRLQADFDNFRKKYEKEKLVIQNDAQEEVIEKLLLMVDNFERTKQQNIAETEKEKKIDASYQGIYKQFVEVMRSQNVSVVPTVGKPFNPLLHEAVAREESQEFKEGIIIKETRRGFFLGDRVLRPALVKVSSGPGNKKSMVASDKSLEQPSAAAGVDER
ncbi:hypothetical protein HN51_052693 [Arachis hypogaea]|uniref:GrpE protein homolog n=1 Tax=Arachis hypogaea TaxID=3818 RepID=A0A445C9P1_ARAHY|nr:uncharacterized protein LOC107606104 [Arachis ipaensis]XP_025667762.1 uncharacterized protein LOC112766122 [Arachis hypogaea]QHN94090.1 Protein GrpE [Arachis hypogaea]RYR47658.1 hypothetical protein Ahy_A07g033600 isoform B [Arachis hypogaea]